MSDQKKTTNADPARDLKQLQQQIDRLATLIKGKAAQAHLPALPEMNSNRWTSVVIWMVGAFLSRNALMQMGISSAVVATIAAIIFQWVLTKGQQIIWKGGKRGVLKRFTIISLPALLFDIWLNASGAWPYTKLFGGTDAWKMVNELNGTDAAFSLGAAFCAALMAGLFIAGAPENLWHGDDAL